jgi:hypothetical protein
MTVVHSKKSISRLNMNSLTRFLARVTISDGKTVIYMHDVKLLILLTDSNQPFSTLILAHLPKLA